MEKNNQHITIDNLFALYRGELDLEQVNQYRGHIDECDECSIAFEAMKVFEDAELRQPSVEYAEKQLDEKLQNITKQHIKASQKNNYVKKIKHHFHENRWRYLVAVAASLLLIAFVTINIDSLSSTNPNNSTVNSSETIDISSPKEKKNGIDDKDKVAGQTKHIHDTKRDTPKINRDSIVDSSEPNPSSKEEKRETQEVASKEVIDSVDDKDTTVAAGQIKHLLDTKRDTLKSSPEISIDKVEGIALSPIIIGEPDSFDSYDSLRLNTKDSTAMASNEANTRGSLLIEREVPYITYTNLTGCIIDKKENAAALKARSDNRLGLRSDEFPVKVNLKEEIDIKQQRRKTCVSHAIAHAMTIMWVRKDGVLFTRDIDKYMFSPYYIHNQISGDCDEPSRITEGLDMVKEQGIALAADFNPDDNCTIQPNEKTQRKALKYKIKDYLTIFLKNDTEEEKVIETKKQLINGRPVIIGINIPKIFNGIKKGTKTLDAEETDLPAYGHSLCVVGYDEYRGAFEVMNSWGTDWANDGYIWIQYDDYARYAKYGYIAILGEGDDSLQLVSDNNSIMASNEANTRVLEREVPYKNYKDITGYIIDEKENQAALKACPDSRLDSRSDEFPIKVNLKKEVNIKQQYGKTSVSHAIAHAMTIMWMRKDGILVSRDIDKYMFSPYYIHNQISDNCDSPSRLTEGLEIVKQQGIALATDFNSDANCTERPDEETRRKALKYRIKDYLTVLLKNYTEEEKITETKKQLINGYPVIIGINIPQVFFGIEKGVKTLKAEAADLPVYGHALCVVGYDDHREAFEVMNSWGTDWANDGYIWIKYDDYARYAKYGYIAILGEGEVPEQIVLQDPPVVGNHKEVALEGTFALRTFAGYDEDNEKPIFKQVAPVLIDDMYLFPDWNDMNSYQLVGTEMTAHSYVYVFSIDAENKTKLHFPKTTKDIDIDAAEEVPLNSIVPPIAKKVSINKTRKTPRNINVSPTKKEISNATMVLPNDMTALQSVHTGTDNICVIYSDNRIDNIQERIEWVRRTAQKDFNERLKAGFKDILVPNKDIKYATDGMSFTAISDKGTAVSLILNVIVNE